jgi:hypothetical protein
LLHLLFWCLIGGRKFQEKGEVGLEMEGLLQLFWMRGSAYLDFLTQFPYLSCIKIHPMRRKAKSKSEKRKEEVLREEQDIKKDILLWHRKRKRKKRMEEEEGIR